MEPIKVGLLGMGTVGGGTVNVLTRNAEEIARRAGRGIQVTHAAARDINKARICDTSNIKLTTNPKDVVNDPEVQIIVELIGGDGRAAGDDLPIVGIDVDGRSGERARELYMGAARREGGADTRMQDGHGHLLPATETPLLAQPERRRRHFSVLTR